MITCQECEAEYEIVHDSVSDPEYCPFCASKLIIEDDLIDEDEDIWDP